MATFHNWQTRTIPRHTEEAFEVTDFSPPSRLAIQGQIGPFNASSSYLLEPMAGGTRLTGRDLDGARDSVVPRRDVAEVGEEREDIIGRPGDRDGVLECCHLGVSRC